MLSRKDHGWFLTEAKDRSYDSDMERKFFNAIENPPEPSDRLKEMVAKYGKYAIQDQD